MRDGWMGEKRDMSKEQAEGKKCPHPSPVLSEVPLPKEEIKMLYKHFKKGYLH